MDRIRIGLFGIGLMGTAIADRLLAAHFDVMGFDVDPRKRHNLVALGGLAADCAAEVAANCPIVVLAVFDTDQVEHVVEDSPGLYGTAVHTAICMSTCDPDRIGALAARAAARGIALLEVPVSGTSTQVARGD